MLQQIAQETNPHALDAAAQALQALAAKLTEAQASQTLDRVLKQIPRAGAGRWPRRSRFCPRN